MTEEIVVIWDAKRASSKYHDLVEKPVTGEMFSNSLDPYGYYHPVQHVIVEGIFPGRFQNTDTMEEMIMSIKLMAPNARIFESLEEDTWWSRGFYLDPLLSKGTMKAI